MRKKRRFESLESRLNFSGSQFVLEPLFNLGHRAIVVPQDMDADGDLDFVAGMPHQIEWYENAGDTSLPLQGRRIADIGGNAMAVADIDLDGDVDILVPLDRELGQPPAEEYAALQLIENVDGQFVVAEELGGTSFPFVRAITPTDFDEDGDIDILLGSAGGLGGGDIKWLRNDGDSGFATVTIEPNNESAAELHVGDIDGDGDNDVLARYTSDFPLSRLVWYETHGDEFVSHVLDDEINAFMYQAMLHDIDGDGDLDIVKSKDAEVFSENQNIMWHENLGGSGMFAAEVTLISNRPATSFAVGDFDADGNLDFVTADRRAAVVYLNDGTEYIAEASFDLNSARVQAITDVDSDGDSDVLVSGFRGDIRWIENRLAGDLNNDGSVGFDDFLVLSANFGKSDASLADGDLDGNGLVEFGDFLLLSAYFGSERN